MVLVVMCVGMFFVLLDVTIVNVALPRLRSDLGLSPSALEWVVDADTLGFAALMLSAGTIGDRTGRKRLVLVGLTLVGIGSLACASASNIGVLLAGRAVQGIGGALLLPQTLAIISAAYPEPGEQARAIGVWAGASSLALPAGPLLGGALVDRFGWPAVFWVNVPIIVVALAVASATVVEAPLRRDRRVDLRGQFLITLALALVIAALIQAADSGWTSPVVLGLSLAGLAIGTAFIRGELHAADPMLPAAFLRTRTLAGANVVGLLMNFGGVGILYVLTLFLQVTEHRSPLGAGLLLLPVTLPLALLAPFAGRLASRAGWRAPMVAGMALAAGAALLLTGLEPGSGLWMIVPVLTLLGTGLALNTAPMVGAVMAATPSHQASLASASNNTARQIGAAAGVAVLGALAGSAAAPGYSSGLHRASLAAALVWVTAALVARLTQDSGSPSRGDDGGQLPSTTRPEPVC